MELAAYLATIINLLPQGLKQVRMEHVHMYYKAFAEGQRQLLCACSVLNSCYGGSVQCKMIHWIASAFCKYMSYEGVCSGSVPAICSCESTSWREILCCLPPSFPSTCPYLVRFGEYGTLQCNTCGPELIFAGKRSCKYWIWLILRCYHFEWQKTHARAQLACLNIFSILW